MTESFPWERGTAKESLLMNREIQGYQGGRMESRYRIYRDRSFE